MTPPLTMQSAGRSRPGAPASRPCATWKLRALPSARWSARSPGWKSSWLEKKATWRCRKVNFTQVEKRYLADAANLPDLHKTEGELLALQSEENRLRMDVGMVRQLVAVLDTQRERKERLTAQRGEESQQIGRLKALERAFSKDGVPALLIEQALPEIEAQANELLDRLSDWGHVGAVCHPTAVENQG